MFFSLRICSRVLEISGVIYRFNYQIQRDFLWP